MKKIVLGAVLAAFTGSLGCSGPIDGEWYDEQGSPQLGQAEQALWMGTNTRLWNGNAVKVCFKDVDDSLRPFIQETVSNGWERAANIVFTGWGQCSTLSTRTSDQLVVSVDSTIGSQGLSTHCTSPSACDGGGIGKAPNGSYNLVRFANDSRAADPALILHEFGHALGFVHESKDWLPNGDQNLECGPNRNSNGTSLENEDDFKRSIMTAYVTVCNPGVTTLSSWDILGAREVYGMKPRGIVSGLNGLNLNIQGGTTAKGAKIVGWNGSGSAWNNRFVRRNDSSLLLTATKGNTRRVLNVRGGKVASNSPTEVVSWLGSEKDANSQFRFSGVQWLAMGDRCVTASKKSKGALLSVNECRDNNSRQKWDFFDGDKRIRLTGTTQCVNVPKNNTANGTQLILYPCATGTPHKNEVFEFSNHTVKYSGKAFNVAGGKVSDGSKLVLWTSGTVANPYHNELFSIRGPITSLGQCLDMDGPAEIGVPIAVAACKGVAAPLTNSQIWEYYW